MVSVYQAKNCFDDIIRNNNAAIADLRGSIQQVEKFRQPVDQELKETLQGFVTGLFEPLDRARLTELTGIIKPKQGYLEQFQQRIRDSENAEKRLAELEQEFGSLSSLEQSRREQSKTVTGMRADTGSFERSVTAGNNALLPVVQFNNRAEQQGLPALDDAGMDYFTKRKGLSHIFSYVCNGHYREGRNTISTFATSIPDAIPDYVKKNAAAQQSLKLKKADLVNSEKTLKDTEQKIGSIKAAAAGTQSESAIISQMVGDVTLTLMKQGNFDAVAKGMESFPRYAVDLRAKQLAFEQMQKKAQDQMNALSKAGAKLDGPLGKLNKAAGRNGHRNVSIDLASIQTGYGRAQKGAKDLAAKTRKASTAVKDYKNDNQTRTQDTSSTSSPAYGALDITPTDFVMLWMIHDMMSDTATRDVAGVMATPGHIDALKNDAIDFGAANAVSDISVETPDMSSITEPSMPDMSSFDLDESKLGLFNIPDISIPDISLPDIDISVPDFGGSSDYGGGGFDGGGGGDCGGGGD